MRYTYNNQTARMKKLQRVHPDSKIESGAKKRKTINEVISLDSWYKIIDSFRIRCGKNNSNPKMQQQN